MLYLEEGGSIRNSRGEKKISLGCLLLLVVINLEGGVVHHEKISWCKKKKLLGVLAPSRGELKNFMGLASSSRRAKSRGGWVP